MNKPTIIDLLNISVDKFADNPFLWEKKNDKFEPTSYKNTKTEAHFLAAGLIDLGVQPGDKIALLSEGRNDWIIGELGILHTGAVNVPLSIKLEESNDLIFRLKHSESKYILVSGGQLKKIRAIVAELPRVEKIVVFDKQQTYEKSEISLDELKENGRKLLAKNPNVVTQIAKKIKPDDYANISYTSGTTADPKGILLTHRNYTANVEQAMTLISIPPTYRTLIILPLDHCFAHVAGFYSFMAYGASVGTVQTGRTGMETLKNIPINIKELKPHILLSVPSLAKNFRKNIESTIKKQGGFARWLFDSGMKMACAYNKEGYNRGEGLQKLKKPLLSLYDKLLFSKVRQAFGGELRFFIGGGALLDIELQRFFYAIGIPMFQGYGLSEATPIISANGIERHKLGSSGYPVTPMELKICDSEGNELPHNQKGEIVIKGENVMAGYYKNEKATAETVVDGWLRTGDMGYTDDDGYLYVVGRFKSLLISSDGEKYSPEGIEESLSDGSKFIEQVILYNNQNNYTSALLVPNMDVLKAYVSHRQKSWDTREGKELALIKIQREINEYKKGGKNYGLFPERWLPATVAVIAEPFSEKNGLMNSSMKIIRGKVEQRYESKIRYMYDSPDAKNIVNEKNMKELEC
ncbi:MAG: AMP-binding protein [Prevotellaceae bacterium]|jgi:long-chain acyl-CoA synthetase|nr:AMP-binding protein [Prevotellaceae bacterium]